MHSGNFKDISNKRFGKLTALKPYGKNVSGNILWECVCECGKTCVVNGAKLINGHTKSCGCSKSTRLGLSKTRIYHIWRGMLNRCEDVYKDNYYWYGLRGISVCEEWHDFRSFYEWAFVSGYKDNLTLDRIDSNDNYYPSNCRWVTQEEQCNNHSKNHILVFKGKKYTMSQFSKLLGYRYHTVSNRIRLGWTPEQIASVKEAKQK